MALNPDFVRFCNDNKHNMEDLADPRKSKAIFVAYEQFVATRPVRILVCDKAGKIITELRGASIEAAIPVALSTKGAVHFWTVKEGGLYRETMESLAERGRGRKESEKTPEATEGEPQE